MPDKAFSIPLTDGAFVVAECRRQRNRIVAFVVRLMIYLDNGEIEIVARYDSAHGIPHLDQLRRGGNLLEKRWLPHLDFDQAYEHAIREFKEHHADYIQRWQKV